MSKNEVKSKAPHGQKVHNVCAWLARVSLSDWLGRTFILQIAVAGLCYGAYSLALNRVEGWGWLLFMALLIELVIHDIESAP